MKNLSKPWGFNAQGRSACYSASFYLSSYQEVATNTHRYSTCEGYKSRGSVDSLKLTRKMEKREFIYQFTNIFLSEAVKETILIENWEERKDFDSRYEEYVKFFLAMKLKYASKKTADSEYLNELESHRNVLVNNFNKTLGTHFMNEIMKRGCVENMATKLIPKDIFYHDKINIEALKTFRALEETI